MIDSGMPPIFVRLIVTWYCEQRACVIWGSTLSPKFNVSNGVRQGGILSPLFFNLYMDRLSVTLSETKVGCALGKTMVNHLAYADDLVILSPSVKGLQKLLNICSEYGEEHDIMFNHKKTECMYFPVKGRALINIPKVSCVMSFNELWRKSLYNFKQRVTKSNNFIVNHVYNFTRATSKIWKNSDHILYNL